MNESWSVWHGAKQIITVYWPVVISFMVVGGLAGGGVAAQNPTKYTARAELITGNYSLPAEVASQPAIAKSGGLGLELPAETQARILASPVVVDMAAQARRLDERGSAVLRSSVRASATTDNSFSISADASTPEEAAANVNAVAAAFLQYRADIGRTDMNVLAERAHTAAKDSLASAAALAGPLAAARTSNPGAAASILAKREELEHEASQAQSTAAALDDAVENFNGGGSVVRPATAVAVQESPSMLMFLLGGLAVGLLAGVVFAVVRRQVTDRIMDRRDIMRATGLTEIFDFSGQRNGAGAGQLLLRSVERSSAMLGISSEQIAVRPLTSAALGATGLLGLAAGGHAGLGSVAAVALRPQDGTEIALQLANAGAATPLGALSGRRLASVNSEIGCEAAAVFGSTPTPTGTYDLLLLATGPHFGDDGSHSNLPAGFSGPMVLVVHLRKDRVHRLEQAMDELNAANLPVVAILMADRSKVAAGRHRFGRARSSKIRHRIPERTGVARVSRPEPQNSEVEYTAPRAAGTKS
ncbi:hypothetical protein [Arthrobacter sp. C9C5]|uniref:hypothetical protein n=1 Tax=Arthrobacter sp. C9C5 TaxID=2735267 RepID=UPI001584AF5F|nr:hypothetical protein [Arthrobacter sp. C9C5]NUU31990.1 hypothetical protein [Arthrobacter sp. C9C5]